MYYIEDYSDDRQKAWCIHCGEKIANVVVNRDHVPTQSFLSKAIRQRGATYDRGADDPESYLPQIFICEKCNSEFSKDESYFLCVLHAVIAGSLYPNRNTHPEAASVLRGNRHVVRALKALPNGQLPLFRDLPPFTIYPDMERMRRIVVKNARGHASDEIGEPLMQSPTNVSIVSPASMTGEQRKAFESIGSGLDLWPEVGSRMMLRLVEGQGLAGGWVEVEHDRYRYAVDWASGVTVRTVICEYLATETRWIE